MKKFVNDIYQKYKEYINYVIIGALTTIVSLGTYYICVKTIFDPNIPLQLQVANIVSWIVAVVFAYFANRKYVFESSNMSILKEMSTFFVARLSTLGLDMLIMFCLVTIIGMNDKIAKLLVQAIIMVTNYVLSKFVVFKKQSE